MVVLNGKNAKPKGSVTETEKTLAVAGAEAHKYTPEQLELVNSQSGWFEYEKSLVHPTRIDKRKDRKDKNTGQLVPMGNTHVVVGYALKVLHDTKVPDFGPIKSSSDPFSGTHLADANGNPIWRDVKAGETVYLTLLELAALAAQPEVGTKINGGDPNLAFTVKFRSQTAGAKGGTATKTVDSLPSISVTFYNPAHARNERFELPVGQVVGTNKDGHKVAAPYPEGEHPEFDKWRPLFVKTTTAKKTSTKSKADDREEVLNNAARRTFLSALSRKAKLDAANAAAK